MPYTIEELKEKLKRWDEVSFLEWFDLTTEDMIEHFQDLIEDKYDELTKEFEAEDQVFNGSEES